ncbi:hypothetical protein [Streptomyces sp. NPDC051662]|uniref:hypothetical protein n=1 Tax=Streptomyces sp. NPDC051662 TaxID=3154750 RepID=UPI003419ED23
MNVDLVWVATAEVKVGDRLVCLLSDARAYPVITGWSDERLNLSRYEGLQDVIHRYFDLESGAPWWCDDDQRRSDLAGKTLIVSRELQGHSIEAHRSPYGRVLSCRGCENAGG